MDILCNLARLHQSASEFLHDKTEFTVQDRALWIDAIRVALQSGFIVLVAIKWRLGTTHHVHDKQNFRCKSITIAYTASYQLNNNRAINYRIT